MNTGRERKYLRNSKWALTFDFLGDAGLYGKSYSDLVSKVGVGERKCRRGNPVLF